MSKEVKVVTDIKDIAFPEISKLQLEDSFNKLVAIMPEHKDMIATISNSLPEIHRSTSLFFKTQSQFMDNMMTVSHNTPLRNMRQILAQMNSTREAIKEAYFKLKKKDIELQKKQRKYTKLFVDGKVENGLIDPADDLKADLLEIEVQEIIANGESTRGYISGAIRQLTNYTDQYNMIQERHGLQGFTEADFELEEERYHIMKAFEQGLCAARTRHDHTIDEGNMIYLTQIGINGAHAQHEIHAYLAIEADMLRGHPGDKGDPGDITTGRPARAPTPPRQPMAPPHAMYIKFLNDMANHFQGSAQAYAEAKGMSTMTSTALIKKGDDRLLLASSEDKKDN